MAFKELIPMKNVTFACLALSSLETDAFSFMAPSVSSNIWFHTQKHTPKSKQKTPKITRTYKNTHTKTRRDGEREVKGGRELLYSCSSLFLSLCLRFWKLLSTKG